MARDKETKSWQYVGIPFDSLTWQGLTDDSRESGIPIPSLIALRCADWYKMARGGLAMQVPATNGTEQRGDEPKADRQAEKNAEEAFDAWKDVM
jgi:hypothetical protein